MKRLSQLTIFTAVCVPIVAAAVSAVPPLVGQEVTTPVTFSVASIKVNTSGQRPALTDDSTPGVYKATNVWVGLLITYAYQIRNDQLEAPEWIRTLAPERFDITARLDRVPPGGEAAQTQAMRLAMRTLLAERFNLVVRRETREVPMWALVVARADGRLGPMLTRVSSDCRSPQGTKAREAQIAAGQTPGVCGMRVNTGRIQVGGYSMAEFAKQFSYDGRSVIDRTGLTGAWDFTLTFAPDQIPQLQPGQQPPVFDPNGPSLTTALQEQLGLKLESTKGTMEVLIVERVERPTEN